VNKTFHDKFRANMQALGLPAPKELFATLAATLATLKMAVSLIGKLGKGATVAEVFGAGIAAEKMALIAALPAIYYLGACIGSLAVATGEKLADQVTYPLTTALNTCSKHEIPWVEALMHSENRPFRKKQRIA